MAEKKNALQELFALAPTGRTRWLVIARQRKAYILGSAILMTLLSALLVAQARPLFSASSRLMLDIRSFNVMGATQPLSQFDASKSESIQSELEVIRSEFLIGRVVDRLGLDRNPDFNGLRSAGIIIPLFGRLKALWRSDFYAVSDDDPTNPLQRIA